MPSGPAGHFRAANWLALAAAPTFASMALLMALIGESHTAMFCTQAGLPFALTGMIPMYLLMAAFHLPPWFRLAKLRS